MNLILGLMGALSGAIFVISATCPIISISSAEGMMIGAVCALITTAFVATAK